MKKIQEIKVDIEEDSKLTFFKKKKHYTVQIVTENQIISKIYLIK